MSTFADPDVRAACLERLDRLAPNTQRQWGKMTPHQMVCHLRDSFRTVQGDLPASDVSNPFTRTVIRFIALRTPMKWPAGARTVPELDYDLGAGTPPAEWERDIAELRDQITQFGDRTSFEAHPIFGKLPIRDWMVWGYRHVDHHFRQFGI